MATDLIRRYYALLDAGEYASAARCFTEDAVIQIAHHQPIRGRAAIEKVTEAGLRHVEAIEHEVLRTWQEDGGVVIFEVVAHYTFPDGRTADVPGIVVGLLDGGLFAEQRIYADLTPSLGR